MIANNKFMLRLRKNKVEKKKMIKLKIKHKK